MSAILRPMPAAVRPISGKPGTVRESGYAFSQKAGEQLFHSYPESLIGVGAFTDWFERRLGQNAISDLL